jgi:hypothetical protein
MTPDALKKRVVEDFKSLGLLKSLDVETSNFSELPRMFEVGHLSMRLVLDDVGAVAEASRIAAEIKHDLERHGVELEFEIRPQWRVVGIGCDAAACSAETGSTPSEHFHVEVESGSAKRSVVIHLATEARVCIAQYLADVPTGYRQSAICKLLATCLNQKLSSNGDEYWNPILYPNRSLELQDVARIVDRVDVWQRELVPGV